MNVYVHIVSVPVCMQLCAQYYTHTCARRHTYTLIYNEAITVCIYSLDDILLRMRGLDLTIDYLEEHGFDRPILVESKDDLGLRVPPPSFKISDIERCVGMSLHYIIMHGMYVCI